MFIETRGNDEKREKKVPLSYALLNPSTSFGGLYAPDNLPKFDENFLLHAKDLNYSQLCIEIIKLFNFDISLDVFEDAIKRYENFDDKTCPVNIKKIDENLFINELYHGPTRAFKDMALQPFGVILSNLAVEKKEDYLIMCATSGDTGPATLETFSSMPNIKVVCLYPKDGTSDVQRLQMICAKGENLKVLGINGNFDDAQNALKKLLSSDAFQQSLSDNHLSLSAANSVNFGRILFQIIYHIFAYCKLLKDNEIKLYDPIDIVVPSGNFGNALGAYYAKKMGVKINKIKIASNANNILTELFTTGNYDLRGKELIMTMSPAMDILISSNVERLLFDKFGPNRTKELLENLTNKKIYQLTSKELAILQEDFTASFCDDDFCKSTINNLAKKNIIVDPHTATCFKDIDSPIIPTIITSTAQWVKFAPSMYQACMEDNLVDEEDALKKLSVLFNDPVPKSILELFDEMVLHPEIINKEDIEKSVLNWIKE